MTSPVAVTSCVSMTSNMSVLLHAALLLALVTSHTANCQTTVKIILQDDKTYGEVVVRYNGQEGAVCWAGTTDNDADVLCRQAGYASGKKHSGVRSGSYQITLLSPSCNGSETDVMTCPGSSWGNYSSQCSELQSASIECDEGISPGTIAVYCVMGVGGVIAAVGFSYYYHNKMIKRRSPLAEIARGVEQKKEQAASPPQQTSAQLPLPSVQLTATYSTGNSYNTDYTK